MPLQSIPNWLYNPPSPQITPPTQTRLQMLPFEQISWKDFERMCLRLARLEGDVEHAQCYGEQGDDQDGIDLFARTIASSKYRVYQCKNEAGFGPAKIAEAVDVFLAGEWAQRSEQFILCTREPLESRLRSEAVRVQSERLRDLQVELVIWDASALSEKLKDLPNVVDDFFGRAWVEIFCGNEAAQNLGIRRRLDGADVRNWRLQLQTFYDSLFNRQDLGLPGDQFGRLAPSSLSARYIFPDVETQNQYSNFLSEGEFTTTQVTAENTPSQYRTENSNDSDALQASSNRSVATPQTRRQAFYRWLSGPLRSVVLGDPGSGKSTLLRFVALDLLSPDPRLRELSQHWGDRLPVWVPFGWWTKKLSEPQSNDCSLEELLESWLNSLNANHVWPLVKQALEDERLLLLVDGLDEWASEDTARRALGSLQVFLDLRRSVSAVLTSRPLGFERLQMAVSGWQIGRLADFTPEQCRELALYWFERWAQTKQDHDIALTQPPTSTSYTEGQSATETSPLTLPSIRHQWAQARADEFMSAVEDSADLRALSQVPLLLCLLIAFRTQNAHLPTGRFELFDKAVDYLIVTHPSRRREASRIEERPFDLRDEELRALFAELALEIQQKEPSGAILDRDAKDAVVNYLTRAEGRFAFPVREAHQVADALLDIGDETTGLVIRKSPTHFGFFHRAFQEFLAAVQISESDFNSQCEIVSARCHDPQWHEVLLCLFARTRRPTEIAHFARRIQQHISSPENSSATEVRSIAQKQLPFDRDTHFYEVAVLLAHLAFGPFGTPANIAQQIANETFRRIEEESWLPHRERLMRAVLLGLRSTTLRTSVQERLRLWIPDRRPHGTPIFNALRYWPSAPFRLNELTETNLSESARFWRLAYDVLWRGLQSETLSEAQAASYTLTQLWGWDVEMGDCLAERALHAVSPSVQAAALKGLVQSFPKHALIETIVDRARLSLDPELRLSGIMGAIEQNRHTENDRRNLLRLASKRWPISYEHLWNNNVAQALGKGWPSSSKTKRACLYLLRRASRTFGNKVIEQTPDGPKETIIMDEDEKLKRDRYLQRGEIGASGLGNVWAAFLVKTLLKSCPQDDDVALWCAEQIELDWRSTKFKDYSQTNFLDSLHGVQWKLLAESFVDHPIIVKAVDEWIDNASDHELRWHVEWALIGRTIKAKAKLLEIQSQDQGSAFKFQYADTLLKGWGLGDVEVSTSLQSIAFGTEVPASQIAAILPLIIKNPEQCRERLIELLGSNSAIEADSILEGLLLLRQLNSPLTASQTEGWGTGTDAIVERALRRCHRFSDERLTHDPTTELMILFPDHPRVRNLAVEEITASGEIGAVTRCYPCQELSYRALERCGSPLPTSLRRMIASQLSEGSSDRAFDISLLRYYNHDSDSQINVEMAIGFYGHLKDAATSTQLGLTEDEVYHLQQDFNRNTRLPNTSNLERHLAAQRECATQILTSDLTSNRHLLVDWFAPIYAASLVFDPEIVRSHKDARHLHLEIGHREINSPMWRIILQHWEEHCALWDNPAQIGRRFTNEETGGEEFWNDLAAFAERYPKPRQDLLGWIKDHPSFFYDENILQFLANVAPRSSLLLDRCFDAFDHGRTLPAAIILGQQFGGDEKVLHRLTHDHQDQPKRYYRRQYIIALCEGWPNCEVLEQLVESVKQYDEKKDNPPELEFDLSEWASHFSLLCLKGKTEAVYSYIEYLLNPRIILAQDPYRFDGAYIMRVVGQRVRSDHELAALLWTHLENTSNPVAKIVLPALLFGTPNHSDEIRRWCTQEIERQLSDDCTPEVGLDWTSLSRRPVVHALLDLTAQGR